MNKTIFNNIISRKTITLDASGKILGRFATEIARLLMGKHKVNYTPNLDNGDIVIITNAGKIILTGKKMEQRRFYDHSGYPGGLKIKKMAETFKKSPEYVIKRTVNRMLPKNKLRVKMLKRLTFSPPSSRKA
jgi:large subunit ribosomal protein L13